MPGSLLCRYSPVPGYSVSLCCVTRYCSADSFAIASGSLLNFRMPMASCRFREDLRNSRPELRRHVHQLGKGVRFHLAHHLAAMGLDRNLADSQLAADQLVQPASDHQRQHLALAAAERRIALAQPLQLRFLVERSPAALDGVADRLEQHVASEGLGQEIRGP